MTSRVRLLLGLLVVATAVASTAIASTEEARECQASQPAPAVEGKQGEAVGNGLRAPEAPAVPELRAADIQPTSWGNVKALWG